MDSLSSLEIRRMRPEDLPQVLALLRTENWNVSQEYLYFCYEMFPQGFHVAVSPSGEIISHCGAVAVTEQLGMVVFHITQLSHRNLGIGSRVFRAAVTSLGDRNFSLSTKAGTEHVYARHGFHLQSVRVRSFSGVPNYYMINDIPDDNKTQIRDISDVPFDQLCFYDQSICPLPREDFLRRWTSYDRSKTIVALLNGAVCGYACAWRQNDVFYIMPLYASDELTARMLFKAVIGWAPLGTSFEIAAPVENNDAIGFFSSVFSNEAHNESVRMFTKECVSADIRPVYSIGGYELTII